MRRSFSLFSPIKRSLPILSRVAPSAFSATRPALFHRTRPASLFIDELFNTDLMPPVDPFFRGGLISDAMLPWSLLETGPARYPVATRATDENIAIDIEVPRFKLDEIKLDINKKRGILRVTGARKNKQGNFEHRLLVSPALFDLTKIETALEDGVYTINVPRKPEIKMSLPAAEPPKKIEEGKPPAEGKPAEAKDEEKKDLEVQKPEGALTPFSLDNWPPRLTRRVDGPTTTYWCEVPEGVKPEDVQLSILEHGALRIRLTMESTEPGHHQSATWETEFPLPDDVPTSGVKAELHGRTLTVTAEAQPRKTSTIPVKKA